MEKDDEVKGEGNSYTAEFWQYSSRLAVRWNLDPKPNPAISPYAVFAGNPIFYSDPKGDTIVIILQWPAADEVLIKRATQEMVKNQVNDGVFIVVFHASPNLFMYTNEEKGTDYSSIDPKKFFELLRKNKEFDELLTSIEKFEELTGIDGGFVEREITLILLGCNAATPPSEYNPNQSDEEKSIAEKISEEKKNIKVVAADGYVQYNLIKKERQGTIGTKGKVGVVGIRSGDGKNTGGWVILRGGVKIDKQEVGESNPKKTKPSKP